jgi:predicted nucleic acid-binding Zn finger protein
MRLNLPNELVLKGENGEKIIFSFPFLNDNKELEFKYCSFSNGKCILNEEKQAIELQTQRKTILFLLKEENEPLFYQCKEIKEKIKQDVIQLIKNLDSGKEPIYAIELGYEPCPFLITSPTILKNGQYSVKYNQSIHYVLTKKLEKVGKNNIELKDYEEVLSILGQKLKPRVSRFESRVIGEERCYVLTIDKMVELL